MAYELFRGYIRTKEKMPLQKFKEADLLSLDEVSDADEYAGVLNTETVLIDIDDKEQSELLMRIVEDYQLDCKVLVTTRGRHFYFRNNGLVDSCHTKVNLACGLTADIKIGLKNSIAVLKYKDKVRPCEWDLDDYDKEDYAKLPKWLVPLKGVKTDLFGMSDGDGRNQELFAYILTLVNFGFDRNEAIDCLNIINSYVFKTPLSRKEFETITREDAFPKATFMSGKQFDHTKFGDFLINSEHIAKINGLLHVYRNGVYVFGSEAIEKAMIANFKTIKSQQRTEVMKYIQIQAPSLKPSDARYMAFRNGVYDIHTQKLLPFSSDFVITNRIDWNFKANAGCEVTDRTLDKIACNDPEVRSLLEECIGYGFYRRSELSKMFVLTGEKANGKSTFLEMLTHLYGDENVSMLDIAELDERFSVSQLVGKLVNIGVIVIVDVECQRDDHGRTVVASGEHRVGLGDGTVGHRVGVIAGDPLGDLLYECEVGIERHLERQRVAVFQGVVADVHDLGAGDGAVGHRGDLVRITGDEGRPQHSDVFHLIAVVGPHGDIVPDLERAGHEHNESREQLVEGRFHTEGLSQSRESRAGDQRDEVDAECRKDESYADQDDDYLTDGLEEGDECRVHASDPSLLQFLECARDQCLVDIPYDQCGEYDVQCARDQADLRRDLLGGAQYVGAVHDTRQDDADGHTDDGVLTERLGLPLRYLEYPFQHEERQDTCRERDADPHQEGYDGGGDGRVVGRGEIVLPYPEEFVEPLSRGIVGGDGDGDGHRLLVGLRDIVHHLHHDGDLVIGHGCVSVGAQGRLDRPRALGTHQHLAAVLELDHAAAVVGQFNGDLVGVGVVELYGDRIGLGRAHLNLVTGHGEGDVVAYHGMRGFRFRGYGCEQQYGKHCQNHRCEYTLPQGHILTYATIY